MYFGGEVLDVSQSWIFPPGDGEFNVTMNFHQSGSIWE
jgi:hypothetical protein